jgi:hypothetical protein
LHVLLTHLSLAPSCKFVGDVLALLMFSFVRVLGIASSVFPFVGVPSSLLFTFGSCGCSL